jgi:hypothetical protein
MPEQKKYVVWNHQRNAIKRAGIVFAPGENSGEDGNGIALSEAKIAQIDAHAMLEVALVIPPVMPPPEPSDAETGDSE